LEERTGRVQPNERSGGVYIQDYYFVPGRERGHPEHCRLQWNALHHGSGRVEHDDAQILRIIDPMGQTWSEMQVARRAQLVRS